MSLPLVPGFILVSKIGSGTFSEVYKGHRFVNSCKQVVAVKCITKHELSATTVNSIIQEIEALKLLRHSHIIHMIDFCWDDKSIYIIMEYCDGGDLSVFIRSHKQLEEKICKSFLCQLASALQYLRQHNIVHMDLKPSNLLLTSGRTPVLKLADFGLAQSLKSRQRETSFRGSPLYMAPEILRRESYDASVDLWSTGVILYECLFGKPPCSSSSLKDLVENIQSHATIIIPTTKGISRDCRDLLCRLLQKDPNKRITFEGFFNHPFVSITVASSDVAQLEAKSVFARAQKMDELKRDSEAVILYRQAHKLLQLSISVAHATPVVEIQVREQLDACSRRIEEIESSDGGQRQKSVCANTPVSHDSSIKMSQTFQQLHSLASTTPDLLSSLKIGLEGVQYDAEGQHTFALERYKAALEKLIPSLRNEAKGARRELLRHQITLWMERAEQLQVFYDLQQSNLEELQSGDASVLATVFCTMGAATICATNRHHVSLGWVRHDEALTKMAAACWARDRFTDVVIFCEDRVLHAHRLVLASMSPLLANLLAEAEGPDTTLLLPEVKAEDMRLLLQFIYQGEVVLPPRRTAALLDLAAQLCVAGVRGGNGPTPPSPPRSDSPELDSSDRNESDQLSEDEHPDASQKHLFSTCHRDVDVEPAMFPENKNRSIPEENLPRPETVKDDSTDDSNDRPMNLAAKPESKGENVNCSRPKPCSSSPPDFSALSNHSMRARSPLVARLTEPRSSTVSYYQHPALRGCHPFSLELAVNHNRTISSRIVDVNQNKRQNNSEKSDGSSTSDVEMTIDTLDDRDREIDLSLKPDSNHTRSRSSLDEEKSSPSPEHDNSFESSESVEPHQGRDGLLVQHRGGSTGMSDMRMNLADKMLLLPTIGSGAGTNADPRRTYLEAVLQESLVQQSYTIVLPSHLGVPNSLASSERSAPQTHPSVNGAATLDNKAWNLAGKHSAAAAVAELQCLQGFFSSHGALSMGNHNDANFNRNSVDMRCDDDEEDEDDDEDMPTNLSTSKNGNCSSSNSMNSKRNGKEGYSCQVCRKMFTSSSNLAVHSMIHSGTKPFKCDLCSWSFRQKAHLQKHMRHIHKIIVAK